MIDPVRAPLGLHLGVVDSMVRVVPESGAHTGAMKRREPVGFRHLTLGGVPLVALEGASRGGFVGVPALDEDSPPVGSPSPIEGSRWMDASWRERAYFTLTGEIPVEEQGFPGGWIPVFYADLVRFPDPPTENGYLAVRAVFSGGTVTWSELRSVRPGSTRRRTRAGRERSVVDWDRLELGPNLLESPVHMKTAESRAVLEEAAQLYYDRPLAARSEPFRELVPGTPRAADWDHSWLRNWDTLVWRKARTGGATWEGDLDGDLCTLAAQHDPLLLRSAGSVDDETYSGVAEDLSICLPPSAVRDGGVRLLGDYFRQVWGHEPDADRLEAFAQSLRERMSGLTAADGWIGSNVSRALAGPVAHSTTRWWRRDRRVT